MTTISTIIPSYNREGLIAETLRSVLSQSRPPLEIIVVDDGSTDGSVDVIQSFGKDVRLIRQENRGAGAARNRGLQEATGDYVHFMDSDDLSSLNTYECQLHALESTGADVAYGPWIKTQLEDDSCVTQPVVIQQQPLPEQPGLSDWVARGWVTVFQPCLFRRDLIDSLGGYREDLKPTEDSELLFRIGKSGARLVHTPETLVVYRVHPEGQVSVANESDRTRDWLKYLSVIQGHIAEDPEIRELTRRSFEFQILDATTYIASKSDSACEPEILSRVPWSTRVAHSVAKPGRRVLSKLRRKRYGDNYMPALGVERVNENHKRLIHELGYRHRGFYSLP